MWGCGGEHEAVAVAGLGNFDHSEWDELERINAAKESVRIAAAAGCSALVSNKVTDIEVEDFDGHGQSAAEGKMVLVMKWAQLKRILSVLACIIGSQLGLHKLQTYRAANKRKPDAKASLAKGVAAEQVAEWTLGSSLADSQNFARVLMEVSGASHRQSFLFIHNNSRNRFPMQTPANLMTPQIFAENVAKRLDGRAEVVAHDKEWAEAQGMGSFLSVSQGSLQPPVFLEITYNGAKDKSQPICLVGKGL